jgi:hypothetical protein
MNTSVKKELNLLIERTVLSFSELSQFCFEANRDTQRQTDSSFTHWIRLATIIVISPLDCGVTMIHNDATVTPH